MNQVKKYLELYIEWIALALGAAFLLWNVYGYVIQKPVAVTVGANSSVAPGDVDKTIWDQKGNKLQEEVNSKLVPPMPKVVDVESKVQVSLAGTNTDDYAATMKGWYTPLSVPMNAGPVENSSGPSVAKVKALPVLPPIVDLKFSGGHSNVPAPLPAGTAGTPAPTTVTAVDKSWRSISGRIQPALLAKAFADANIPPQLASTAVLRVVLIREERDNEGNWEPETEIPALPITAMEPLPVINAPPVVQTAYQQWAETHTTEIMRPAFYQVLQGDIWYVPGAKNPNEVQFQLAKFDPKTFTGDPDSLSPEDRKAYEEWKDQQRKEAAAAKRAAARPNQPPTPPPGVPPGQNTGGNNGGSNGGGGRRGRGLATDPERPPYIFQPGMPPGMMPPPGMQPGMQQPAPQPIGNGTDDPALGALPAGTFDPTKQPDFIIWAHDDTVQAGKTYRYKIRYIVSSPVARSVGLCNPQTLANNFYLVSPDSQWTAPISVESDTNFYATKVVPGRNQVTFDVFRWKDGIWQMQTVTATPGDMVGGIDATNKTDFSTGWTVVDIRTDRDDNFVILLTSGNGTVLKKESSIDLRDSHYHALIELVNKDKPKTASATP